MSIETVFSVPFVTGKGRPRFTRQGHVYTPAETARDQAAVTAAYQAASTQQHGRVMKAPKGTPVEVHIATTRPIPKSAPKSLTREPDVYGGKGSPDIDNVVKLVLDALNGLAWADDCQVVRIYAIRNPRTRAIEQARTDVRIVWAEPERPAQLALFGGKA